MTMSRENWVGADIFMISDIVFKHRMNKFCQHRAVFCKYKTKDECQNKAKKCDSWIQEMRLIHKLKASV